MAVTGHTVHNLRSIYNVSKIILDNNSVISWSVDNCQQFIINKIQIIDYLVSYNYQLISTCIKQNVPFALWNQVTTPQNTGIFKNGNPFELTRVEYGAR
jgi:hypothetical protein